MKLNYAELVHIGDVFGYLPVLEVGTKIPKQRVRHKCMCRCGKIVSSEHWALTRGKVLSCGCYHHEMVKNRIKHGKCRSTGQDRIYRIYRKMLARCYSPRQKNYDRYGGRGIKVCDEWLVGFIPFMEWAYSKGGYSDDDPDLSIDRIDVDGDYCPENCQFITISENVKKAWAHLRARGRRNYRK